MMPAGAAAVPAVDADRLRIADASGCRRLSIRMSRSTEKRKYSSSTRRRRLQRVPVAFVPQEPVRYPAQLSVHQREQFVHRGGVTVVPAIEQPSDVSHRVACRGRILAHGRARAHRLSRFSSRSRHMERGQSSEDPDALANGGPWHY